MAFFKQTRELLLIEHSEKAISDEELLLLLEENTSRNPEFSYENYARFNLEEIEEPECKAVVIEATTRSNQSERSRNFFDQSESSI